MTDIDPAAYRAIAAAQADALRTPDDVWRREYMDTAFQATPDDSAVEDAVELLDELRDKYDMDRRGVTWLMQAFRIRLLVEAEYHDPATKDCCDSRLDQLALARVVEEWLEEVADANGSCNG